MTATLETPPRATAGSTPNFASPVGGNTSDRGQHNHDAHVVVAPVGHNFPGGHGPADAQCPRAPGEPQATNTGQPRTDTQQPVARVGSDSVTGGAMVVAIPNPSSPRPSLFYPTLYTLAQYLDDVEGLRKAQANRLRILTTSEPDEDGVVRGFGYDETHPVVAVIGAQLAQLEGIEHQAVLELQRVMRKHPLNAWRKTAKGVGEKQLARLLAAVGDPYIRGDNGQPRTVSQLWACPASQGTAGQLVHGRQDAGLPHRHVLREADGQRVPRRVRRPAGTHGHHAPGLDAGPLPQRRVAYR